MTIVDEIQDKAQHTVSSTVVAASVVNRAGNSFIRTIFQERVAEPISPDKDDAHPETKGPKANTYHQ